MQIRTEKCNGDATCVCALYVRSGRSGYVIDTCGDKISSSEHKSRRPPLVKMYDCHENIQELITDPPDTGNKYTVN